MPGNSARGSFNRTNPSVGGRSNPSTVGRGISVGRGSPLSVGRGTPLSVGRASPSSVDRGYPLIVSGSEVGVALQPLVEVEEKYTEYMIEKFGPDISIHPLGDLEAWERAVGGVKKGRLKGAPSDPGFVVTGISSTQSASQLSATGPDCAYVDEVERLKAQVASLLEERKQEKEAAAARMTAIEQMLAKFAPSTLAE